MGADPRSYGGDALTREVDRASVPRQRPSRGGGRPWHSRSIVALRAMERALDYPDRWADKGSPRASTYRMDEDLSGHPGAMFVFFSNRLGCFGSLLVSAALTLVLLVILNVI